MKKIEKKILDVLEQLKPYLKSDGGDVEFIKFEKGIVYVRFQGACRSCPMLDSTIKDGIEMALKEQIPEVSNVINLEE